MPIHRNSLMKHASHACICFVMSMHAYNYKLIHVMYGIAMTLFIAHLRISPVDKNSTTTGVNRSISQIHIDIHSYKMQKRICAAHKNLFIGVASHIQLLFRRGE